MAFEYKNNPLPEGSYRITSNFGWRTYQINGTTKTDNHQGIDLGAVRATPIYAVADGKVTISKFNAGGYGWYIEIDHGDGVRTRYAHMYQSSPFKVGDTVSARDVIGGVGTTGNSTGNHLHFEIIMNGTRVDPREFIDSGQSVVASPEDYVATHSSPSSTSSTSISNYPNSSIPLNPTSLATGQRVSKLSPQPLHAFVHIRTGDNQELLSTKPNRSTIVQHFEYNRLTDAGETVQFTIFDDDWQEIEKILSRDWDKVIFQYGYHGTGLRSKIIRMTLQNYNISFTSTGTILSVEATTQGAVDNLNMTTLRDVDAYDTYNPTEAVKHICKSMGFVVKDENFDVSKNLPKDPDDDEVLFVVRNSYPITYILQEIIPQASSVNEEIFRFWIDTETNEAYFKRDSFNTSNTDNLRTYVYQKGYDSPVINFDVQISGIFGGSGVFGVETGYKSIFSDPKTKKIESASYNKSEVVTEATGDTTHTRSTQSIAMVDSAGYTPEQMRRRLYYSAKASGGYDAYEATLTIVGDPTLNLYEYIRVINVTDSGYLHHTSGVYQIKDIIDSVDEGQMTTVLKLQRNAVYGDIDGLEILHPTYRIDAHY